MRDASPYDVLTPSAQNATRRGKLNAAAAANMPN